MFSDMSDETPSSPKVTTFHYLADDFVEEEEMKTPSQYNPFIHMVSICPSTLLEKLDTFIRENMNETYSFIVHPVSNSWFTAELRVSGEKKPIRGVEVWPTHCQAKAEVSAIFLFDKKVKL